MPLASILAAAIACASPEVHDGDSIRCGGERIRIANIDAPELPGSPKCEDSRRAYAWCDYEAGYRARDALQTFLSRGPVQVQALMRPAAPTQAEQPRGPGADRHTQPMR